MEKTSLALSQIFEPIRADLEKVDEEFARHVQSKVALIPQIALSPPREDIAIRTLADGPVRSVIAATPASARLVPATGAMLGILEALAAAPLAA